MAEYLRFRQWRGGQYARARCSALNIGHREPFFAYQKRRGIQLQPASHRANPFFAFVTAALGNAIGIGGGDEAADAERFLSASAAAAHPRYALRQLARGIRLGAAFADKTFKPRFDILALPAKPAFLQQQGKHGRIFALSALGRFNDHMCERWR